MFVGASGDGSVGVKNDGTVVDAALKRSCRSNDEHDPAVAREPAALRERFTNFRAVEFFAAQDVGRQRSFGQHDKLGAAVSGRGDLPRDVRPRALQRGAVVS